MKIRVADLIVRILEEHGIRHCFLVTGGGAMHLNDAFGRSRVIEWVSFHHEQACAMAAQSYFRLTGRMAAVNVTTGPGGTNAITGVYGAFVDSLAMLVVSGQVKRETTVRSTGLPLRQLGDQEIDIVRLVEPITKWAVMLEDPRQVRFVVERALHLATTGRPGPVWIDVPMDVQGAIVETEELPGYEPARGARDPAELAAACHAVIERLAKAERAVIMPGSGVRLAGVYDDFRAFVDRVGAATVTAFNAHDLLPEDHPLYAGRPGTVGDRAGNFAVQNADFLLVLGCRLNIRQISYNWKSFARAASIAMVDVDEAELKKPTLRIDLPIHADLRDFFREILPMADHARSPAHAQYVAWCRARRARYPVVLPEYGDQPSPVNPYVFVDRLFAALPSDAIVVTGDGTACVATFQAAKIQQGQRLFSDSGSAPMGFDLPAAIGASIAAGRRQVVCVAGDGSMQMNLQELQTIATQRLPIALFVLNNGGYHSIRHTQAAYFPDNPVGCGPESRVGFPDFAKLAQAFGFAYARAESHGELDGAIRAALEAGAPALCEIVLDRAQPFAPKLASRRLDDGRMVSSPLEDLAPFLSRDELRENMLVPMEEP